MAKSSPPEAPENDPLAAPSDDHAYFLAIEETFVNLRGSPLLLSPADWKVARRWHQQGIPLRLIRETLEEIFARREESGKSKVNSLRYVNSAVERAWKRQLELLGPATPSQGEGLDVPSRLEALAWSLPEGLAADWRERIRSLSGDPGEVEKNLSSLDEEFLQQASELLSQEDEAELETRLAKALEKLSQRLPAEELAQAAPRLRERLLRELLGLPVLSLFSPESTSADRERGD